MTKTYRLDPETYYFTFGPNPPALRVRSGDTVVAPTRDAGGLDADGKPMPEEKKPPGHGSKFVEANPLVGPIYVEEAEVGDALAVHIEAIELTRRSAWSRLLPHFGSLTGEGPARELLLNEPIPQRDFEWALDLEREVGVLELTHSRVSRIEIPLHPFLGSIGVAPRFGRAEMSLTPGDYGGNMDCVETKAGTTIYFPVGVQGAYLAFGDVHAAQGDGELCGVALETTAEVTLRLEVLKGWAIDWPRLEDDSYIMTAGSARPLIDALRLAEVELVKWLTADYGFEKWEAWQVVSQVGTIRVGNVVDPNYTVVAKFPKNCLP